MRIGFWAEAGRRLPAPWPFAWFDREYGMTPRGDVKIKERADALDMGDLPTRMGYALRRAQITVFEDFIARLAPEDIRPAQYSALKLIGLNPGARQTDVSAALGIQRSNFGPLFDGLEQRGLVERRRSQGDRRSLGLYLTGTRCDWDRAAGCAGGGA